MKIERFEEIRDMVNKNFKVIDSGIFELDDMPGQGEYLEFEGPVGLMRLEGITKPAIEKTEMITSKRIGAQAEEKHVYSQDQKVFVFNAYKWDNVEEEWLRLDLEDFGI